MSSQNPDSQMLTYRGTTKFAAFGLLFVSALLFICLVVSLSLNVAEFFINLPTNPKDLWVLSITNLFLFLVFFLSYRNSARPMSRLRLKIFEDHFRVSYGNDKNAENFFFKDIVVVSDGVRALAGGKVKLKFVDKRKFSFTLALRGGENLVEKIYSVSPGVLNEKDFLNLRQKFIYFDQSYSRFRDALVLRNFLKIIAVLLFVPILLLGFDFARGVFLQPLQSVADFAGFIIKNLIVSAAFALPFHRIFEYFLYRNLKQTLKLDPHQNHRNLKLEATLAKRISVVFILASLLAVFCLAIVRNS